MHNYQLKLFVTGMSASSVKAIENIKRICDKYLNDDYALEIIDIYKQPALVQQYDIIACPTLLKVSPAPLKRIVGDLGDTQKALNGLGIKI